MKLIKCVSAYRAVTELSAMEWSYRQARSILQLKGRLEPEVRFFAAEELKLVRRFAEQQPDRNGAYTVSSEQAAAFQGKRQELEQLEVLEDFLPTRLTPPDRIRPELLEALEGFVEFEEGCA